MVDVNPRLLLARAAFLLALVVVLALLLARSSLTRMLPFAIGGVVWLWLMLALAVALLPSLLARDSPLPAAAFVVVPALATASYGASRLDWLRLLKDFGVAEADPIDPARLMLGALALALLWGLHAVDTATRLRDRAIERGIEPAQANAARGRVLMRTGQALGLAALGAMGLLVLALLGTSLGNAVSTERGAFVVPLVAAALLVGAAVYLARRDPAA